MRGFHRKVDGEEEDEEEGSQGYFSDGISQKIFEEKGLFFLDEVGMDKGILALENKFEGLDVSDVGVSSVVPSVSDKANSPRLLKSGVKSKVLLGLYEDLAYGEDLSAYNDNPIVSFAGLVQEQWVKKL